MNALGKFISSCFYDMWENYCETNGERQVMAIEVKGVDKMTFGHIMAHFEDQIIGQEFTSQVIVKGQLNDDGVAILIMEENDAVVAPELEWDECSEDEDFGITEPVTFKRIQKDE